VKAKILLLILISIAIGCSAQIPPQYEWLSKPGCLLQVPQPKEDLAKKGIILLDNDAAYVYRKNGNGGAAFIIEIRYAVDKGYGYSDGPFTGYLWLQAAEKYPDPNEVNRAVKYFTMFYGSEGLDALDSILAQLHFVRVPWSHGATYKWSSPN
jgi:hypothetical protein